LLLRAILAKFADEKKILLTQLNMSKPTLLILAAGMASRYGSLKQVDGFGPHGETIIDYSIYDAIRAGFGKVVFIIREEFLEKMKTVFDEKLKGKISKEQNLGVLPMR